MWRFSVKLQALLMSSSKLQKWSAMERHWKTSFSLFFFGFPLSFEWLKNFDASVVRRTSSTSAVLIQDFKFKLFSAGPFFRVYDLYDLLSFSHVLKGVKMLTTYCPLLDEQAERLRNLYDTQHSLMSRDGSAPELRAVEYELIRAHKAMKRHRIRCPQCKLNDQFMTRSDMRLRPLPSEAPLLPIQVY